MMTTMASTAASVAQGVHDAHDGGHLAAHDGDQGDHRQDGAAGAQEAAAVAGLQILGDGAVVGKVLHLVDQQGGQQQAAARANNAIDIHHGAGIIGVLGRTGEQAAAEQRGGDGQGGGYDAKVAASQQKVVDGGVFLAVEQTDAEQNDHVDHECNINCCHLGSLHFFLF